MKRLNGSSDSLSALMSTDENQEIDQPMYNNTSSREFGTMLEEEEPGLVVSDKKRRLTVDQVKALEKSFDVDNKLEPERKVKLAKEIGLQPRQVAVWFQNRRARYKTKQLERDHGILKANFDNLKQNYDTLRTDNQALFKRIQELKRKLVNGDSVESDERRACVKEEETMVLLSDTEHVSKADDDFQSFLDFKDGFSDSTDSSAILNEENIQFLDKGRVVNLGDNMIKAGSNFMNVKAEEYNFFGGDEQNDHQCCSSLFSDEQAPTLHWYSSGIQFANNKKVVWK